MKKFISLLLFGLAATAACLPFSACSSEYSPEEGEYYYEYNGVYRVITLSDETPQTESNVALNALSLHSFLLNDEFTVRCSGVVVNGSVLFYVTDAGKVNSDGAQAVYECLGLESAEIADQPTGTLYTNYVCYNKVNTSLAAASYTVTKTDDWDDYDLVAEVGNVTVYKFNYEDRSKKNGSVTGSGSFSAVYCNSVWIDIANIPISQ